MYLAGSLRSSRPKLLVKSPEMLSCVAFIMLKNILASLLHIYRACFVSSKIRERTLIYRASFILHQGLKIEIYYTFIPSACFVSSLLKERGMLHIHSACFVARWFKERDILQKLFI